MSLSTTTNRIEYSGDDATTVFSFPYYFLADGDLVVIITDANDVSTTQTITTHYTVAGAGASAGGSVTMLTAPATGETLVIYRDPALTQGLDLRENDSAPAESTEEAFDRLTMITQRLDEQVDRAATLPDGYAGAASPKLPTPAADKILGWDSAGTALENKTNDTAITTPSTSTDNAVVRWSGTSGTVTEDSGVTVDDSDNLNVPGNITATGTIDGVAAVVGETEAATLTNKTIDGDNNTISNLAHGAEVDNPTSGAHGITGSFVGTSDAQDLTNKTFTDAVIMEEIATPSNPASGDNKLYFKNDQNLYKLDSSGNEIEVGAGGSGGGINYATSPDFESGVGDVTTTANVTESEETTNQIRGTKSLNLQIGTGASTADYADISLEAFDEADTNQSKKINVSFEYYNDANYSNDDVEFVIRDNTAAGDIPIYEDNDGSLQSSANIKRFQGSFHTAAGNTDYSLRMNVLSAPGTASNIKIDNVKVSPEEFAPGAIITEAETVTVTGSWVANTTYTAKRWQYGDRYYYDVRVDTTGAPTATTLSINLPSGDVIDTAKMSGTSDSSFGDGIILDSGSRNYDTSVKYSDTTSVQPVWLSDHTGSNAISATNPFTWANGDSLQVTFSVPIVGLKASNLISTTESLFSTTKVRYTSNAGQSIPNNTPTILDFEDKDYDDFSHVTTGASWKYTASKNEVVRVSAKALLDATTGWAPTEAATLIIYKNGTAYSNLDRNTDMSTNSVFTFLGGADTISLVKGDYIDIRINQNSGAAITLFTTDYSAVSIEEVPDFSVFGVHGETELLKDGAALANFTTYGASGSTYYDLTSLALTPGEWDIHVWGYYYSNGATTTSTIVLGGHNVAGNNTPDADKRSASTKRTASSSYDPISLHIPGYTITSAETFYLKIYGGSSVTNLQLSAYISARRIK